MRFPAYKWAAAAVALAAAFASAQTNATNETLKEGFVNPPQSAMPRVWWHWMNGNITKDGIKLDLEWMHRVGIAGFQNFDAALQTPQVVKQRLAYMTPPWQDAFSYATRLANQLGMEEAIAGSPGWSESGGPWVAPSEGMKKYVWSATDVEGGKPFTGKLAHPPEVTGAFQTIGIRDMLGSDSQKAPEFYADAAVVAYRRPSGDVSTESLHAKMSASGGTPDFAKLNDGDLEDTVKIPIPDGTADAWIQWEFDSPQTISAVTYVAKDPNRIQEMISHIGAPERILEASDDGVTYREVAKLTGGEAPEHTVSFEPVKAKYFRVVFKHMPAPPPPAWAANLDPSSFGIKLPPKTTDYEMAELILHPGPRVNHWQEKAAFVPEINLYQWPTPSVPASEAINKDEVIDLTSKMKSDGTLDWTPPPGNWVVLRIGYSLLGITNHPATKEATGLEVDKMNGADVRKYFETYLDSYKKTVGPDLMGKQGHPLCDQ